MFYRLPSALLLILALPGSAALPAPVHAQEELRVTHSQAYAIATSKDLPGKWIPGQCLPFALALYKKLQTAGIRAEVLGYHYESGGIVRGHAVVAFEDRGRTYVMDNQSMTPRWVEGNSPGQLAGQFSGLEMPVKEAFVVTKPRRLSSTTAAHPNSPRPLPRSNYGPRSSRGALRR